MHSTNSPARRTVLRTFGALAVAAPAAGLLASCAGVDEGSTGTSAKGEKSAANPLGIDKNAPLDVVIFKGGYGDAYAKYHQSLYTKAYPKAKIKHSAITEIQTEMQPRFVGGTPPDVLDNTGAKKLPLATLVANKQLTELTELLNAPSVDDPDVKVADTLVPGALDAYTFDGKVMAMPYVFTAFGFWYSKSLFQKKGWTWPTTWAEMLDLSKEIKAAGMAPFAYGGTNAPDYFLTPFFGLAVTAGGQDVLKAIDNLEAGAWTSPAMKDAAKAIAGLAEEKYFLKGCEGMEHTQAQTAWVNGDVAIYASGSWIESEMKSLAPSGFDMVFGTTPVLSAAGKLPNTTVEASAGEPFVVPKQAKNAAGGLEYIRQMLSKKGAGRFSDLTKSPTVVKDAVKGDLGSTAFGSVNKALAEAGRNTYSYRFPRWYPDLQTELKTQFANLLAGRVDADKFLSQVQKKADAIAADKSIPKYTR